MDANNAWVKGLLADAMLDGFILKDAPGGNGRRLANAEQSSALHLGCE